MRTNFKPSPVSFRITDEEFATLKEIADCHQTDNSKIFRAFLAQAKHYPKISTTLAQFVPS